MIRSITYCLNRRLLFSIFYVFVFTVFSFAQNAIVIENANAGNPISEWGVPDFRDNRIAGYSTKMSLNSGETVRFKINVQSGANYTLRIYRIGYYGGNGARLMANLGTLNGTIQPGGISDPSTGSLDCSNWSESATWAIPASAVSGFYIAKIERTGGGSNHIAFIVRNDASNSDLYLQFPDATWQAYNGYGGNSMYDGNTAWPAGHAVKVSYNRPFFPYNSLFNTDGRQADWYMNATYPMIRWLERNGYDITYTSCNDVARNGSRLLNHKVFISIGHDEYFSKDQRANIEAARNAGVHLAFFTGNEVYWKTRWENNSGSEDRTLVCYKEGFMGDGSLGERACGYKCDPSPEWTGLWRTGGNYDAGKPENGLVGQISWVEYPAQIEVPSNFKKLRFWRNSAVANLSTGQVAALGVNTLGYEWDYEQAGYASSNPAGRITMSSKTINSLTHKLSLYRHSGGALVFGAGTVQWSWGLDGQHWGGSTTVSPDIQQATVNLFADMGVQAGNIQSGLTQTSLSTDFTAPTATITSPANGATFSTGANITFSGNATDAGGGVVAAVEISVDGGNTWRQASFSSADASISWSYSWTAVPGGSYNIRVRGVDDSGNIGNAASINITVGAGGDTTPPTVSSVSPTNGSTGVSINTTVTATFSESINGSTVTGTTFQLRDAGNNLVSASVSTTSNQITLTPTAALTGPTTYTVTIVGGASGVKDQSGNALVNNYTWTFTTVGSGDITPPTVSSVIPVSGAPAVNIYTAVTATLSEAINASTVTGSTFQLRDAGNNLLSATVSTSSNQITLTPVTALTISTTYTVTIVGGASGVKDLAGNALAINYSWSFTTSTEATPPPVSIQSFNTKTGVGATSHSLTGVPSGALLVLATTADAVPSNCIVSSSPSLTWTKRSDAGAAQSDNAEIWTAVYSAGGSITVTSNWGQDHSQASVCYVVLNAESTLGGASATGVSQSAPSVTISTTRDNSIIFGCTADFNVKNGATRTLRDAATERLYYRDGNFTTYHYTKAAASMAAYTLGVSVPTGQSASTALLEIRSIAVAADIIPPTVTSITPVNGATGVLVNAIASAIFSEAMDAGTINGSTIELRNASNVLIAATISYNAGTKTATLTPSAALATSTVYTMTIKGGAAGVKDIAGNPLAIDYTWSFTTEVGDITPPTITSVIPVNGASGVLVNTTASAIFDEAMDAGTINGSTIELRNASNVLIAATISYNAGTKTVTLTPSAALATSTVYTMTIKGGAAGVKDIAGNPLAVDYTWSFTTEVGDITPPTISSVAPVNGASGVLVNTTASAIFDEAMNAATINGSTIELRNASNVLITATISYDAGTKTVTLTPSAALATSTVYTMTIKGGTAGVKDIAGNPLAVDYTWSFTTEVGDITAPTISSVTPVNGATGVLVSAIASAIFDEAMNAATINGSTIELRNASNVLIAATISYNAGTRTATITPSATLANSTVYTVTIKGGAAGVKDIAGNALAIDYTWSFTTEVGDITPPTISSVTPVNGASGVLVSSIASAIFDEAMNAATINGATIELRNASNVLITTTISYNAGTRTATITPSAALTNSTVYTVTIKGGAAGAKDIAGNALAADYSWSFTTEVGDIIPPTVLSVSPLNGATGATAATNIIANFSEAVNSSTVTASTFQLRDAGGILVNASLSTSLGQITMTPSAALTASTTYTVTIVGGAPGVKDLAGNALVNNYAWTFTTAAVATTYTLFQPSNTPAFPLANDETGIELGMRFRSTQDGFITGIRYYKGAGATGTHIGSLWNNAGTTRLAQATFTNETTSGWQQVLFSSPVAITAGVTYVASYFSPSGDYAATKPYFTTAVVNGPLRGLADGEDGANGLYRYTTSSAFPNSSFQSSNYWVDVVFSTGSFSDVTPPTVTSVSPLSGATGISINTTVIANFSEAINSATVTASTFQLRDAGNNLVAATVSTLSNQITLTPLSPLNGSIVYTATITGGASGVKDPAGNALASNYTWSFTTATVDNTAPTVLSTLPASAATGVNVATTVIANFNEAINASTVTATTFQLRNSANALITATVSISGNQITLTPSAALSTSTVYTVTITGGVAGVKDLAGNSLASDYSWSFTTVAPVIQPVTVQSFTTRTGTGAISHSLTGVPAGALLVLATTADAFPSDCLLSSSPSLTWTKRSDAGATNSDNAEIWTAVYGAGGSITVTSSWGQDHSQASVCYIVLNAEPVLGGASATAVLQSAPSVTINTTRENSIIFGCSADWDVINGSTRTLRDAATERLYFRDNNFTTYHYTKAAPAIAAYTLGVSFPTGQQSSTALLEIRSSASPALRPSNSVITAVTIPATNVYNNSLAQNFPNPFNKVTNIPYTLSKAGKVNLVLLDISGRVVKVLVNASKDAGKHTVIFDDGSLAKGIYYYRIQAGDFTDVKKLIIW